MNRFFCTSLLLLIGFAFTQQPAHGLQFRKRYSTQPGSQSTDPPPSTLPGSQSTTSTTKTSRRLIELRIVVGPQSGVGAQQEWLRALEKVGAEILRIENSNSAQVSFEERGSGPTKTLSIVAIVKRGKLYLPGGNFSKGQTQAIREHLDKLRADGGEVTSAEKVAFGLTTKQLVAVHEKLGIGVSDSTKDKTTVAAARSITKNSGYTINATPAAKKVIANSEQTVGVELKGFSRGTALAYTLRKMGLVFIPKRETGKPVELIVDTTHPDRKNWPVGWPVSENIQKAAPKLFAKFQIEGQIHQTPLLGVLGAVESELGIPFFYDHAKISSKGIDLAAVKVSFAKNPNSAYNSLFLAALRECKPALKPELRIDEAGKRFFWITPVN